VIGKPHALGRQGISLDAWCRLRHGELQARNPHELGL
jgi:hypothetical protein